MNTGRPARSAVTGRGVQQWRTLVALVLPSDCAGCGRDDARVCGSCRAELAAGAWPDGPRWQQPDPCPPGCPLVVSTAPFAGVARTLVTAYKDEARQDVLPELATLLAASVSRALARSPGAVLVPAPSSAAATRRRGGSPVEVLVRYAAGGAPNQQPVVAALRQRRRVFDQSGLDAVARAVNLEQSMEVRERYRAVVAGARCVVVDDVVTTGATLVEAARALRAGGAREVVAATVCATQRRARPVGRAPCASLG